jgi:NAD-dependent SIR2 family protein deacetylase
LRVESCATATLDTPVLMADDVPALADFIAAHPRLFVLTGAGISTNSGIPAYRDARGNWQRAQPITHQQFVGDAALRRRYWARSMLGWPVIARATPNAAHRALAQLEHAGRLSRIVTQNVDGLHHAAGSKDVIELHGTLHHVVCLDCGGSESRAGVQRLLEGCNPELVALAAAHATAAPDGDAHLEAGYESFVVPSCPGCGGTLMPDVVFFGGSIPRARVDATFAALDDADAMLVVGSSLSVYSGFRLCERAHAGKKPIAAVNRGVTRADDLFALKVDADCAETLVAACTRLSNAAWAA